MDDSKRDSLFFLYDEVNKTRDSVIMRMDMPGWSNTFGSYIQIVADLNNRNRLTLKADNYVNASLAEMVMHMHFIGEPQEPPMYLKPGLTTRTVSGLYQAYNHVQQKNLLLSTAVRL
jgi:iron complex outermembrane receptor protein